MIGFGFVQNWVVLIPLRVLLGTFEAGFFPGMCKCFPLREFALNLFKAVFSLFLRGTPDTISKSVSRSFTSSES